MDIKNKLVDEIKKDTNIDISNFIEINDNQEIICNNTSKFTFNTIFISDFWNSGIHNCINDNICKGYPCKQYIPIGTSEDNNLVVLKKYFDILVGYNCFLIKNKFIIKKI
jgi:hypothetical protein